MRAPPMLPPPPMLRLGYRAANLVASLRLYTVRDFPSCADIDLDLACFRVCNFLLALALLSERRAIQLGADPVSAPEPCCSLPVA